MFQMSNESGMWSSVLKTITRTMVCWLSNKDIPLQGIANSSISKLRLQGSLEDLLLNIHLWRALLKWNFKCQA